MLERARFSFSILPSSILSKTLGSAVDLNRDERDLKVVHTIQYNAAGPLEKALAEANQSVTCK